MRILSWMIAVGTVFSVSTRANEETLFGHGDCSLMLELPNDGVFGLPGWTNLSDITEEDYARFETSEDQVREILANQTFKAWSAAKETHFVSFAAEPGDLVPRFLVTFHIDDDGEQRRALRAFDFSLESRDRPADIDRWRWTNLHSMAVVEPDLEFSAEVYRQLPYADLTLNGVREALASPLEKPVRHYEGPFLFWTVGRTRRGELLTMFTSEEPFESKKVLRVNRASSGLARKFVDFARRSPEIEMPKPRVGPFRGRPIMVGLRMIEKLMFKHLVSVAELVEAFENATFVARSSHAESTKRYFVSRLRSGRLVWVSFVDYPDRRIRVITAFEPGATKIEIFEHHRATMGR